ncbi:Peptidyl-prolyl cis-trans isomerase FKBP16-1, chloroplastic [Tetrabaena socialis]|uniref:peptidylprolyl isomerase n=1 Tax=Tetrabaena socialis TaxID=47790 RepID=A0A2J8ADT2_9CHLO|nr:Peptidyl-prolyl cis-trans isomerase FKBP16-1, chloroplastic [Tetrabaena socialis]|eukprot:PNH10675.1 Peptidyl-prolyl cis-trans isomerase FKBP16-1, chloroplastic [Tetrabaena socialis]
MALAWASSLAAAGRADAAVASGVACPGLGGYRLQQCLREARKAREAAEAEAEAAGGEAAEAVRAERLRREQQYEQPGTLVTLPSGLQFREIVEGSGPPATRGSICEVAYVVYRLASGGYYKYSGGGTPVFMFSLGYGQEGKDDVGVTYRFRLGDPDSLPAAVTPVLEGMRQGGKRRVLVPPRFGWVNDKVGPRPDTFGGQRRLAGHRDEPLLFEAELVRVRGTAGTASEAVRQPGLRGAAAEAGTGGAAEAGKPFRLPAPPSYYGQGQNGR